MSQGYICTGGGCGYSACAAGKYSYESYGFCLTCPCGNYCPNGANCGYIECPAGQFTGAGSAGGCSSCAAGTFSTGAACGCTSCPCGQYQASTGARGCSSCPAGQYQASTGQTGCTACPCVSFTPTLLLSPSLRESMFYIADQRRTRILPSHHLFSVVAGFIFISSKFKLIIKN